MFQYIERLLDDISLEARRRRFQGVAFTPDEWAAYAGVYETAYRENLSPELFHEWEREVAQVALLVKEGFSENPHGAAEDEWEAFSRQVAGVIAHDTFEIKHNVDLWPQIKEGLNAALPGIVNPDNPPMIRLPEHPRDFRRG